MKLTNSVGEGLSEVTIVNRKSMKKGEFEKTSEALFMWFLQMEEECKQISGLIFQSKALELINRNFSEGEGFTANIDWLSRWEKRCGIGEKELNLTEEKLSEDTASFTDDKEQTIKEKCESFDENDSCDGMASNYSIFPVKTPITNDENSSLNFKESKGGLSMSECSDDIGVRYESSSVNNENLSGRRKHVIVSMKKKLKAVKHLNQGETLRKVASELGISETTVSYWKKRRDEIKKLCSQKPVGEGCKNAYRKTMKKGEFEKTSEALFLWFLQMREKGVTVSDPILQNKALELHKNFSGGEEFTASSGWLKNWKKRYGVGGKLNMTGKTLSVGSEETADFIMKAEKMVEEENLSLDESHSCDETVVNTNMSLEKTQVIDEENSCSEYKQSKDKLLILDCSPHVSVSCGNSIVNDVMSIKRKHVFVSLEKKLEAIKRLDQGETLRRVAIEFGVGEATVSDWKKKREDIEKWCSQRSVEIGSASTIRKTMRKGEFEKTSEALFSWFLQMEENGSPVSGPILQSKALELHKNFNEGEEFTASSGWLERWKKRYGISGKKLKMTGGKLSIGTEETAVVSNKVEPVTKEESQFLDENQSCDETVMNCVVSEVKSLVISPATNSEENSFVKDKQSDNNLLILANRTVSGSLENITVNNAMSGKRKHVVVSLEKKLGALRRLDQGETMRRVASELGVGGATVWDWRKKRKEIEKWCSQRSVGIGVGNTLRKTMRKGEFEKTSEALFLWFLQMREKGIPVSGPILQNKALELHKHFNEGEFTASSGWLERWKKRYGIGGKKLSMNEGTLSTDMQKMAEFVIEESIEVIKEENTSLDENYSCNEASVDNKMLTVKTLTDQHKQSEDMMSISALPHVSGSLETITVNSATSGKRKHVVVSLEKKLGALRRLDQGEKLRRVASELGVGGATVWDWRKKRKEIEKWCSQRTVGIGVGNTFRKTMRKGEFEKTSEALFLWFLQTREKGIPVSGPILQNKALELHKHFNEGEFTASSGWLERWKKRYGIGGKKLGMNEDTLSSDMQKMAELVIEESIEVIKEENVSLDENYSCIEAAVDNKMLTVKTLIDQNKQSEDKMSISAHPHVSGISCGSSTVNRPMKTKRKRIVVSLEKKLEALKSLDQGQTMKRVASELGVSEGTVGDWKKKREDIEKWCSQRSLGMGSENIHRKTMKKGEFEKTSEALYMWFLQMKESGSPVSGPILQSKALELHKTFTEGTDFTASNGWFERWKRRYGISGKKLNTTGEKLSDSVTETIAFTMKSEKMIEEESLSVDENYSCDEAVRNYNIKTPLKHGRNSASEYDQSQDRLSTLSSSNVLDNQKQNHSVTVKEEAVTDKTTENTCDDPREDVPLLVKEELFIVEENYNNDTTYPNEFVFISCDTEHEKAVKSEDCLENQSPPERNIKSENIEILGSDGDLDKKSC